jgi:heat shock protein HslJ
MKGLLYGLGMLLLLGGCSAQQDTQQETPTVLEEDVPMTHELLEGKWLFYELFNERLEQAGSRDEQKAYLSFDVANAKLSGFTGCNSLFGSISGSGSSLQFSGVGMTEKYCEGAPDQKISEVLQATRSFSVYQQTMGLLDVKGELLARLAKTE